MFCYIIRTRIIIIHNQTYATLFLRKRTLVPCCCTHRSTVLYRPVVACWPAERAHQSGTCVASGPWLVPPCRWRESVQAPASRVVAPTVRSGSAVTGVGQQRAPGLRTAHRPYRPPAGSCPLQNTTVHRQTHCRKFEAKLEVKRKSHWNENQGCIVRNKIRRLK